MTVTFETLKGPVRIYTAELQQALGGPDREARKGRAAADDVTAEFLASPWLGDASLTGQTMVAVHGKVTSVEGNNTFTLDDGSGPVRISVLDVDDRSRLHQMSRDRLEPAVVVLCDLGSVGGEGGGYMICRRVLLDHYPIAGASVGRFWSRESESIFAGSREEPISIADLTRGHIAVLGGWGNDQGPAPPGGEETGHLVIVRGRVRTLMPFVIGDCDLPDRCAAVAVLGARKIAVAGATVDVVGRVVILGVDQMSQHMPGPVALRVVSWDHARPPAAAPEPEKDAEYPVDAYEPEPRVVIAWQDAKLSAQARVVLSEGMLFAEYRQYDAMGVEKWVPGGGDETRLLAEAAIRLQLSKE